MARETAVSSRSQARFKAYQWNSDIRRILRAIASTGMSGHSASSTGSAAPAHAPLAARAASRSRGLDGDRPRAFAVDRDVVVRPRVGRVDGRGDRAARAERVGYRLVVTTAGLLQVGDEVAAPVPPGNSIASLSCRFGRTDDAVMVGWPGAAQDRLPAHALDFWPGCPDVARGPRSPEVSDDQGHDLRERDRGLCGNLLNHRTLYR